MINEDRTRERRAHTDAHEPSICPYVPGDHHSSKATRVPNRLALFVAAALVAAQIFPGTASAENKMGYQLLSPQAAASLPRNGGSLGVDIERAQQITDDGMTFDIIRVKSVRHGSPGAQAGFSAGDQIIAVDGRVFSDLKTFAAYVGSVQPGTAVNVDYIPANGGPAQAQRVAVTVGTRSGTTAPSTGMSTGTKVAIGVGAAALLGCYELGCFSHRRPAPATAGGRLQSQQPGGFQQLNGSNQPQPAFQRQ